MKSKTDVMNCLDKPLAICDTTLRNGEQATGVVFSNIEKYRIAQLLDEAGVPQIEAGIPMMGAEEMTAVRHIARMGLDASVMAWNRADINDINTSIACDVDSVSITMAASDYQIQNKLGKDRQWVLDKVYESVSYAADHGIYISCIADDASRADLGFLIDFAKVAKEAGADRIGYCDTIGVSDPFSTYERIKTLRQIVSMDFEIIARNDFGLATANCLAGIKAGAKFASVTSMGIGERAGCAPLEEVAMAAKHILNIDSGIDGTKFREIAEAVGAASGRGIPAGKAIIGNQIFAQEAGVSVNGVVVDENGQAYDPQEVGCKRSVVIGKHSARNTLISELFQMGIELSKDDADALLRMVRKASSQMHRSINPKELFLLYQDMMSGNDIFDESPDAVPMPEMTQSE